MLAGYLSSFFNEKNLSSPTTLYGSMGGVLFVGTVVLIILAPTVRKLMSGVR